MWICTDCDTKNDDADTVCACCGEPRRAPAPKLPREPVISAPGRPPKTESRQNAGQQPRAQEPAPYVIPEEYAVPEVLRAQPVPPATEFNAAYYLFKLLKAALYGALSVFFVGMALITPVMAMISDEAYAWWVGPDQGKHYLVILILAAVLNLYLNLRRDSREAELGRRFAVRQDGDVLECRWPADLLGFGRYWALAVDGVWTACGRSGGSMRLPLPGTASAVVTIAAMDISLDANKKPRKADCILRLGDRRVDIRPAGTRQGG